MRHGNDLSDPFSDLLRAHAEQGCERRRKRDVLRRMSAQKLRMNGDLPFGEPKDEIRPVCRADDLLRREIFSLAECAFGNMPLCACAQYATLFCAAGEHALLLRDRFQ